MSNNGHILVDLDNTLATYDKWQGVSHIGEPIYEMVERVKGWLAEGKKVKLFTARWSVFKQRAEFMDVWKVWSEKHIGEVLPVTCTKDFKAVEIWDDRAVRVINGRPCCS